MARIEIKDGSKPRRVRLVVRGGEDRPFFYTTVAGLTFHVETEKVTTRASGETVRVPSPGGPVVEVYPEQFAALKADLAKRFLAPAGTKRQIQILRDGRTPPRDWEPVRKYLAMLPEAAAYDGEVEDLLDADSLFPPKPAAPAKASAAK